MIQPAQAAGWSINVVATPAALPFLDVSELEQVTGTPVRSESRDLRLSPNRSLSESNAFLVAPATYNTVNKLALGIADTYALTTLAEAIGSGVPVVLVPFVNSALASRLPYQNAVASLRREGVRVVAGVDDGWLPRPPGTSGPQQQRFPWHKALAVVAELATSAEPGSSNLR